MLDIYGKILTKMLLHSNFDIKINKLTLVLMYYLAWYWMKIYAFHSIYLRSILSIELTELSSTKPHHLLQRYWNSQRAKLLNITSWR